MTVIVIMATIAQYAIAASIRAIECVELLVEKLIRTTSTRSSFPLTTTISDASLLRLQEWQQALQLAPTKKYRARLATRYLPAPDKVRDGFP